ncbi:type III-B CRISPR module-associated protein Cmr5, partial [Dehalococcoidales bacterium]|nr:type III-B CRISPR module-associated protein Cmr5 [Dehalococcoidales bacterium]
AHIQEWLCQTEICKVTDDEKSRTEFKLIVWLTDSRTKSIHYRRATLEALSLASWLKRFSEALAPD